MNNVFIFERLDEARQKLGESEIPFTEMEIDSVGGILLDNNNIVDTLTAMGVDIVSHEETTIPGISKASIVESDEVRFVPDPIEPPAPIDRVSISAPAGHVNRDWEHTLGLLKRWLTDNYTNIGQIIIHETRMGDSPVGHWGDQLHILIGQEVPAGITYGDISYLPAGRLLGLINAPISPNDSYYEDLIDNIKVFIPIVMASTPEEAEQIQLPPHVKIIDRDGYRNNYWKRCLRELSNWVKSNITGVEKVIIYEAYESCPRRVPRIAGNELHLFIGRLVGDEGYKLSGDISYFPAGRAICFSNLNGEPNRTETMNMMTKAIEKYLPIVLAPSVEEAEALIPVEASIQTWRGNMNKDWLKQTVEEILIPVVGKSVYIHVPHGSNVKPMDNGVFNIHVWSAISGHNTISPPTEMWGFPVNCRDQAYLPTDNGIIIYDSSENQVAEIIGDNLYIFHDAVEFNKSADRNIMIKILEESVKFLQLSEAERTAIVTEPKVIITNRLDSGGNVIKRMSDMKTITEELLLPVLERKILIHYTSRNADKPIENGQFHIWIWSSKFTDDPNGEKMPVKLLGCEIDDTDISCFPSSQSGIDIIDEEVNYIPAEIVGDNLYIHIPLFVERIKSGMDLYRKIIEMTVVEVQRSPEDRRKRDIQLLKFRFEKTTKHYINACLAQHKKLIVSVGENLKHHGGLVAEHQKALISSIRKESDLRHQLGSLQDLDISETKQFEEEYLRLIEIDGVKSAFVEHNKLIVNTEHIYITEVFPKLGKELTFDIGEFRIEISIDNSENCIRFFNTTRKAGGGDYNSHHPHVQKNGTPCLGNIKGMIPQLVAEYQFAAVINLAIQYLRSVNLGDSVGSKIADFWTIVSEKEVSSS